MGNIDSKRGSADSIMGCQPNRTRQFSELPNGFQSLQYHSAGYGKRELAGLRRLNNRNANKKQLRHSSTSEAKLDDYCNADGSCGDTPPPPIVIDAPQDSHRQQYHYPTISPQNSESCTSLCTQPGAISNNSSFRTLYNRHTSNNVASDNTSLPCVELARRPTTRVGMTRRAKSFRNPASLARGGASSFRRPTCELTGLTERQKKLISVTWLEMYAHTAHAMIHAIFDALQRHNAALARFIVGGESDGKLRDNPKYRLHVKRFYDTLSEVIRTLSAPLLSADLLLELGADYYFALKNPANKNNCTVIEEKRVPLINASNGPTSQPRRPTRADSIDSYAGQADGLTAGIAAAEKENQNRMCTVRYYSAREKVQKQISLPKRCGNNRCRTIEPKSRSGSGANDPKSSEGSGPNDLPHEQIPLAFWEAFVTAFTDAIKQIHREINEINANNSDCNNGITARQNATINERPSSSLFIIGDSMLPQQHFRFTSSTPSPTPTNSSMGDASSMLCNPASPNCYLLYFADTTSGNVPSHSTNSPPAICQPAGDSQENYDSMGRGAISASYYGGIAASYYEDQSTSNNRLQITRDSYGSQSFNALSPHRSPVGHFISAPSYGNFGIASPLATSSATPSPNLDPSNSLTPSGSLAYATSFRHRGYFQRLNAGVNNFKGSILVPEVEAWSILAVYVVGQLRFGYEMERALHKRMARAAAMLSATGSADCDDNDQRCEKESLASVTVKSLEKNISKPCHSSESTTNVEPSNLTSLTSEYQIQQEENKQDRVATSLPSSSCLDSSQPAKTPSPDMKIFGCGHEAMNDSEKNYLSQNEDTTSREKVENSQRSACTSAG